MKKGKTIKLGEKRDYPEPLASAEISEEERNKIHYPSLWLHDRKSFPDLPKRGVALVEYDIVSRTETKRDNEKPTCSLDIEIRSFTPVEEKGEVESDDDSREEAEEAFERGMKDAEKD